MAASGKGSIILKILAVILAVVLYQTITIPDGIWTEENNLIESSRNNITAIYEAEKYYYSKKSAYLPSDSLEQLLAFVQKDSALAGRQQVGRLTNQLVDAISGILEVPAIQAILPISQSLQEIRDDVRYNSRFFVHAEYSEQDLIGKADNIGASLATYQGNNDFPSFSKTKLYTDSLSLLRERINERSLQNAVGLAIQYADSLALYLGNAERDVVGAHWADLDRQINELIASIAKTTLVSNVSDRLERFSDRINGAMNSLTTTDLSASVSSLKSGISTLSALNDKFAEPQNFLVTERKATIQLTETDSILVKFTKQNFVCPDSYQSPQPEHYIISYRDGSSRITVECPNLTGAVNGEMLDATRPLQNMPLFAAVGKLRAALDSTSKIMTEMKDKHRLSRLDRSGQLILDIKEVQAEMGEQQLENAFFYRYSRRIETLVDTLKTERKFSAMETLLESTLNPMDTLAARMENGNISDLESVVKRIGAGVQKADSVLAANIPARVKRNIPPFYDTFSVALDALNEIRSSFSPQDAQNLRAARTRIEKISDVMLNGSEERVYAVFPKKHINHGYITLGTKSWEKSE